MIILASASPRRRELLSLICDSFSVEPADIDEAIDNTANIEETPALLARKKAEYIFNNGHQNDIVIGCDTGVFIDGLMLGKPENSDEAFKMLSRLSGREHKVITGCALFGSGGSDVFSCCTSVNFYELTSKEIKEYIDTGEPMDKAGAYGIQGKGSVLVKEIKGDFFNVVGLPIGMLKRRLADFI